MAKVLRYSADKELADVNKAESRAFMRLKDDFIRELKARFLQVKDNIEDWDDTITNEELLKARLQTLAAKDTYTENNLKDIALISMILWNIEEE
jgi:hypothetical protein